MTADDIQQFLIVYDVRREHAQVVELGTDYAAAIAAYEAAEAEHRNDPNYDIVLIGSDCLETVRRTHASYFTDSEAALRERVERRLAVVNGR